MFKKLISKFGTLNRLLGLTGGALILITSILMTYEVIMRYFFNAAPSWTSDVSRYLLLFIAFVALGFTLQEKAHINVDFLITKVSNSMKKLFDLVHYFAVIIFSTIVGWITFDYFKSAIVRGRMTQGNFMIPNSWLYAIMIIGLLLLTFVSIVRIIENITSKSYFKKSNEQGGES